MNFTFWFGWVLLAVPLVLLASRLRIERRPRVAVPVHLLAILAAAIAHVAIQTTADVSVIALSDQAGKADALGAAWPTAWSSAFPLTLTRLIDWELIAGAAIVGITHAGFYHAEARQRAVREAQLETRLVEAQLRMLQHQLHPHFLFNTLHAVSTLMHRDVAAADRMLATLSDLLRLTLDSATPALLLQPLVENAIKHGIAPLSGPGRVTIGARTDGDWLLLTVADTGPGPADRDMTALSAGIGVANTRARLTHQFGQNYRFEFRQSAEGFTVLVAIPFRPESGETDTAVVA